MRSHAVIPALFLCASLASAASGDPARTLRMQMAAPSLGDASREVRIHLPPGYDPGGDARYPVVFLLHGWPGTPNDWFRQGNADATADRLMRAGAIPPVILVCPDGRRGILGRSFYVDAADGRCDMERYLTTDLVAWVDSTFRTLGTAASRGIIGLSDGGLGAVNLVSRHPDIFTAAGSHSGNFVVNPRSWGGKEAFGVGDEAVRRAAEHDPMRVVASRVESMRRCTWYIDCGVDDEDLGDNRDMHRTLASLGIAHDYFERPGSHTWGYWRRHLEASLTRVADALR